MTCEDAVNRTFNQPLCSTTKLLERASLFSSFAGTRVDFIIESHDSFQTLQAVSTKPFWLAGYIGSLSSKNSWNNMVAGDEIPPYKDRDTVKTKIDLKGQLILDSTSTS